MIATEFERAKQILLEHKEQHNELAKLLMEREVIFTEDVERIFGPRPWKSRTDILMEEEALKLADQRTRQLEAEAAANANANANNEDNANANANANANNEANANTESEAKANANANANTENSDKAEENKPS